MSRRAEQVRKPEAAPYKAGQALSSQASADDDHSVTVTINHLAEACETYVIKTEEQ